MKSLRPLLALCLALLAAPAHTQGFTTPSPGYGMYAITGDWRFHTGDDLRWLSPSFDDSKWESISGETTWGAQTHPGYYGFAWYRLNIEIDNVAGSMSIAIPPVESVYELYWNGQRIGGFGRLPPHPIWSSLPHSSVFPLPAPDAKGRLKGLLALRVWMPMIGPSDPLDSGGFYSPALFGDSLMVNNMVNLADRNLERTYLPQILSDTIFILVALIAIGMWAFDRSRRLHLWFGIFLLGIAAEIQYWFPSLESIISYHEDGLIGAMSNSAKDLGIWMLILVLFGLDKETLWKRVTAVLATVYLLAEVLNLSADFFWASGWRPLRTIDGVTTTIISILPIYLIVLIIAGLRRRRDLSLLFTVIACAALELYHLVVYGLGATVQFTHLDAPELFAALTIHLGPYNFTFNGQLQLVVLIVLIATITREQVRERNRQLFIESELKSAHEVQSVLVPEETPSIPGFDISSLYWPAGEVGGDMFQVIPGPSNDVLIILADVSGKGLKAAMTVSLLVGAVRTLADTTSDPLTILSGINHRLIGRSNGGFSTCLILHVSAAGLVTLANAGHLEPFLNGEAVPLEGSLPLGLIPGADFPVSHFQLNEGDDLTLYTDGVLEAQRETTGELFGFDRTAQLLSGRPSVRTIAETARTFGQADDITVIKIARTPTESTQSHISIDVQTAAA
jgi:hypothetical protein